MSAPWCLSQRKVSSPQCRSQNNEKALPHINLTECPISRCRHLRKTNPGPWQWTDHIYGQQNQVLINPFSVSAKFVRLLSNRLTYFIRSFLFFVFYPVFFTRFEHTPLATPNGDILIKDLSFEVLFVSLYSLFTEDFYILHKCDLMSYYLLFVSEFTGRKTSRDRGFVLLKMKNCSL